MRKEASLEQWKELYEAGLKIKELKPWNYLWDMDLITIKLPEMEEPCFCSIFGHGDFCYGINTFIGYDGLRDFTSIVNCERNGIPVEYIMLEQSNLSCNLGNRDEVPNKQKQVIKNLNLKFRGKNEWLYFESCKKGYIPYILDEEETLLLTGCLEQLILALEAYTEQKINVDFEKGETLLHQYDSEKKEWTNQSSPLPLYEYEYPSLVLQDDILKAKMKKQPKISTVLELDMAYINTCITDKKYDRPVNPKLLLLMDHANGIVIAQEMISPGDDEANVIFNILINFVMGSGRAKQILIRNQYIASIIDDTCEYCSIPIIMKRQLKAIDEFLLEFDRLNE